MQSKTEACKTEAGQFGGKLPVSAAAHGRGGLVTATLPIVAVGASLD